MISKRCRRGQLSILTECLGANDDDAVVFAEYLGLARLQCVPFFAFTISCGISEQCRRLQLQDRKDGRKRKLTDLGKSATRFIEGSWLITFLGVLEDMMATHSLLDSSDGSREGTSDDARLQHHVIDTTASTITQSAMHILSIIAEVSSTAPSGCKM